MARQSIQPEQLRQVGLFCAFDDTQLQQIATLLQARHFCKGDIIVQQGEPGGCLYLIASGQVRVYLESPNGHDVTLRIYKAGHHFGEFSVIDGAPRSASIAAMTKVTAYVLYRDDFMNLLRENFAFVHHVLLTLLERLRYTTIYSEKLAFLSASGRVIATLIYQASTEEPHNGTIRLQLTQQELAALSNTTRESVSYTLRGLTNQSLVQVERGGVVILNLPNLQRLVE
jgi:CRP-like cAMP-binding protein